MSRFWSDKKVFVTGATGLLGSWLVEALVEKGAEVTCLVRDWFPKSMLVESGTIREVNVVKGRLEDYHVLVRALNEYEVETVFHLGAQTIVGTASRSSLSTFESNIKGTWSLLEACRVCSSLVKKVVVASSDKAYGAHDQLPYKEETPLQGRFPYDVSKSCADLLTTSYWETHRLPVAVTRCGNLYGGGDFNFNRLIPGTIASALKNQPPVIRSDGTYIRDYFYIRDAVNAYLTLAENLDKERFHGQAFNFGTETPVAASDVVTIVLRLMGKENLSPVILGEASREIPKQYLDCAKARRELNWSPRYTLEEGLKETIEWYEEKLRRHG